MIYIYIYLYVGFMSTFVYGKPIQKNCMLKCVGGITLSKHAHGQSQFWEFETKCRLESLILFLLYARAALAWMKEAGKKSYLEMRNLSKHTEEQGKERLEDRTQKR